MIAFVKRFVGRQIDRLEHLDYAFGDPSIPALVAGVAGLMFTPPWFSQEVSALSGLLVSAASDAILYGKVLTRQVLRSSEQRDTDTEAYPEALSAYRAYQNVVNVGAVVATFLSGGFFAALALALAMWFGTHDKLFHILMGYLPSMDDNEAPWKWWTPFGLYLRARDDGYPTNEEATIQAIVGALLALSILVAT